MENSITETIEKLYDKAETFGKTSISLAKHIAVFNIADVVSNLAVKLSISIVLGLSFLFANIGLAIYLGEVLLSLYKGFLIVAGFYLIVALLFYIFREMLIKNPTSNFIISTFKKDILS